MPVIQTRGFHVCKLCDMSPTQIPTIKRGNETLKVGSAEIRVFGQDGTIYAAPNLIYHYVVDHHYRPPDLFIQAVLGGVQPGTSNYHELLCQNNWI